MATRFKTGDLVEPTESVVASYSNYGLNPKMAFEPGMLGVVRHVDMGLGGVQVEFFEPRTGLIQKCRTFNVSKIAWPKGTVNPREHLSNYDWWGCGSMAWRGAINLLRAIAALRPEHLAILHVHTLRLPLLHDGRIRRDVHEKPTASVARSSAVFEASQLVASLVSPLHPLDPQFMLQGDKKNRKGAYEKVQIQG